MTPTWTMLARVPVSSTQAGQALHRLANIRLPLGPGVNLQEIDRPYSYEGFRAERFRPAIEHEADISIFTRALKTMSDLLATA